jgi:hypothetical protein
MAVVTAKFGREALVLSVENESKSIVISYRERPDVFGHPRFLFGDFDQCEEIIRSSLRKLELGWSLVPPKVVVTVEKELAGGITKIDERLIREVFMHGGARDVVIKNG